MHNKKTRKTNALMLRAETVAVLGSERLHYVVGGAINLSHSRCLGGQCDIASISNC
jgi:hypothetical protein